MRKRVQITAKHFTCINKLLSLLTKMDKWKEIELRIVIAYMASSMAPRAETALGYIEEATQLLLSLSLSLFLQLTVSYHVFKDVSH